MHSSIFLVKSKPAMRIETVFWNHGSGITSGIKGEHALVFSPDVLSGGPS